MQPLKLKIEGDFIDSQIYSGLLYLWTYDGMIKTINFEKLVMSLVEKEEDFFTYYCAFLNGRYLYKSGLSNLMSDPEFNDLLLKKLKRVSKKVLVATKKEISKSLVGEQDFAGNQMHIDSEIYSNALYISNDDGLFSFNIRRPNTNYPVSTRAKKIWDLPVLSITANRYPQFALSGGSEGLYELNKSKLKYHNIKCVEPVSSIYEITTEHSNYANYNNLSLFNTSFLGNSALYQFSWTPKNEDEINKPSGKVFRSNYPATEIFGKNGKSIAWGSDDKIYYLSDGYIKVAKYNRRSESNKEENESPFDLIGTHELKDDSSSFLFGKNAFFGIVIETDRSLIVLRSDEKINVINGPISRWRTFPRSRNYENHLHVIQNDSLEIYSFYHDFIRKQDMKTFGIDSELFFDSYFEDEFVAANNAFRADG